ncbi:hypothetical protein K8W59_00935 [Nocardioides rotundus]|uniref:hypothetical protein n=1 Tax=Nocardioides rotundus TaxID=1774216 RepID=UPI001CBE8437|nr:hypothetical protein [Nocardioides rotundus]UAL30150.1 hypothetical protein K8W59_00935 [Nocardioides rotundus]
MNDTAAIDRDWQDRFVMGLRLRDASPELIADQLALVRAHCAESGESAVDAFGDPTAYADSVVAEWGVPQAGAGREVVAMLPPAVGGFLAGALTIRGATALIDGESFEIRVGGLVAALILVGAALALVRLLQRGASLVGCLVLVAVATAVAVLLDVAETPLLATVPAWVALGLGLVALAVLALAVGRSARRQRLIDPVDGRPMG